jgi:acyl transferase domain-containing protein
MGENAHRAIAIVGLGAVLPDAPDVATFWDNVVTGRYSISEVTPDRWDPALYYDPDPRAPDKTYSTIGGWVRDFDWDPLGWKLPIPPRVSAAMDRTQKWAIIGTREALADYGYPQRPLDPDRTAVILGNAMGGDLHYMTALRLFFPEYAAELGASPTFAGLPGDVREAIVAELHRGIGDRFPEVTEDTMPGELANIIAGRVANLFDLHGPNFVTDAACASAMAAIDAAIEGLEQGDYDAVITGGIDANMSASTFIKFCKIGALSATGTRPYADGADGFVMGEGGAVFLLKRLADAERDGDDVYAVIRGMGGASDGRGKGITAPNPVGQLLAVQRAWDNAGIGPDAGTLVEGHGTSTRVGDVVEVESLSEVFSGFGLAPGTVPLGSVKSNIGHLKGAAGAAGLLKATLALHHKTLPPSLNFTRPNPNVDFTTAPFYVNTETRPWEPGPSGVRTAAVSAFGFGGTNFHAVLEEYVPGRLQPSSRPDAASISGPSAVGRATSPRSQDPLRAPSWSGARRCGGPRPPPGSPRRGGGRTGPAAVGSRRGRPAGPRPGRHRLRHRRDAGRPHRPGHRGTRFRRSRGLEAAASRGVFHGAGPAPRGVPLHGPGIPVRQHAPGTARRRTDRRRDLLRGGPGDDPAAGQAAQRVHLRRRRRPCRGQEGRRRPSPDRHHPAGGAGTDAALTRLMAAYGIGPDMVMGHSLGEYGALTAADALPFPDALEAVSARGREMTRVSVDDNGKMLAVFGPLEEIQRIISGIEGYVEVANINSNNQAVVGGASPAVTAAAAAFKEAGFTAVPLPVSHAFHTSIVAPASEPLMRVLERLDLRPPALPIVANVSGDPYPMGPDVVPEMIELLGRQISSPVQFVKGLHTLYDLGARVFVEMGPKKALHGFVEDVLGGHDDVVALFTNHPKAGDVASFNQALCGLYAAGLGVGVPTPAPPAPEPAPAAAPGVEATAPRPSMAAPGGDGDVFRELGHLFAEFLDRGMAVYAGRGPAGGGGGEAGPREPVVITGAAIGLPGGERIFDDDNVARILHGEQFIDAVPVRFRQAMVDKNVTRLVKSEAGGGRFEVIDDVADVIKLAARGGALDLAGEFGFPEGMLDALDIVTELAIGAGIDALRDAGLPLVMHYKTTTRGTRLPDRWMLPDALRDDTGVIFASAFPGSDSLVDEVSRFHRHHARVRRLDELRDLVARAGTGGALSAELDRRIREVETELEQHPYTLDRKFLFRALSMGHSQFAQYIGARGPNTQVNSACASTTQAVSIAEDWIGAGRCRRVVIVSADDVTSDHLMEWVGAGFLASGAAATDEAVADAAIPFDRRRHGLILGMGGAALVVESAAAARERGLRPIAEVLSTVTANSAFHGTRLDVDHIRYVVEDLVAKAERRWGVDRHAMAPETVFVSHETYTPARGGSAQAEVDALRYVFGDSADRLVVANTKGFTGHPMGVGIEDVVAVKALETGIVPPVANFREVDPDLGALNLSRGGAYPVRYALRLGAGFGSQISLSLMRWVPTPTGARTPLDRLGYAGRIDDPTAWARWLAAVTGDPDPAVEVVQRTLRVRDRGAAPAAAPAGATPVPRPEATAPAVVPEQAPAAVAPAGPGPRPRGNRRSTRWRRSGGRGPGGAAGAGGGGGADGVSARDAGSGSGSGGGPGDRHGEAGRDVRRDPGGVRDRAG